MASAKLSYHPAIKPFAGYTPDRHGAAAGCFRRDQVSIETALMGSAIQASLPIIDQYPKTAGCPLSAPAPAHAGMVEAGKEYQQQRSHPRQLCSAAQGICLHHGFSRAIHCSPIPGKKAVDTGQQAATMAQIKAAPLTTARLQANRPSRPLFVTINPGPLPAFAHCTVKLQQMMGSFGVASSVRLLRLPRR